ncbi:GNAT family N-acetyltransferase [Pedobacter insulae]|uniref:Ribosomal-protein-alanine N-acetyltransferase n=1 Tax=Pedobacter insulae TaxID=414048 RepID=A0A1I2YS70_9SPHI|nr:GNAT family N-acetyltransferase [Pedobacter insulae]SFH28494.1 ribosomal-protein-alanine N-acetyltransferase [Pedobacter insulae]
MATTLPTLKTPTLLLRPFLDDDIELVFQGLSNPQVIHYYGVHYKSLAETKAQMRWFKELEANGTGAWWAIFDAEGEVFYGGIGLNNLSKVHKKAEIGFWLLPSFWGRGIVLEAANLVCKYGFNHACLHRIEAFVESANENCKNLMNKLDFKHEGTMQECEIKNEKYISLEIYAKIY